MEQIQLFKFNELSKEAKEKAIENVRNDEGYIPYEWWDFLFENFKGELKEIGLDAKTFYFDFYRYKDFKAEDLFVIDENKLLKSVDNRWFILNELRKNKLFIYSISLNEYGKAEIEYEVEKEDNLTDKEFEERKEEINKLEEKITFFLKEKFNDFLSRLGKEYEYLLSGEAIADFLEANEFEFKKDGTRY